MSAEMIPMFDDLPMDNPGAAKKPKESENKFSEIFRRLVDEKELSLADIEREAASRGIKLPWSTLTSWYKGLYKAQILDKRLKVLADILEVSLEYLVFGEE